MARDVGLDWNERELHELLRSPSGPVARELRQRAAAVKRGAQRRCPAAPEPIFSYAPGALRRSVRYDLGSDAAGLYADIGTRVWFWHFVEFGVKPHTIASSGDWPMRTGRGQVIGPSVRHPGHRATPFLRPALDDLRGG